jgi:hypothetical protein
MSLVEAIANVAVGYGVAVAMQIAVFPLFGLQTSLADNLALGAIFTMASIARSYVLRRTFEAIRVRRGAGRIETSRRADPAWGVVEGRWRRSRPF